MKALVLNSGLGSRMKDLATCKCLVELDHSTTIFDAQMESMLRCGINSFVVTTGAYADDLELHARTRYPYVDFIFVNNPLYSQTNYIYSIYLAREWLMDDDILLMHGDLVYEQNVLQDIMAARDSVMVIDSTRPLPEKDFKAIVKNGCVHSVSVNTFSFDGGQVCYAQPMYKLLQKDWAVWLDEIIRFCVRGETGVYAENALNCISHLMNLLPLDITGRMCFEVDNREDLAFAQDAYSRMPDRLQEIYSEYNSLYKAESILSKIGVKKPFVVCGVDESLARQAFGSAAIYFSGFTPNPDFSEVMNGISIFENEKCDFIVSFGGGSAIDVAKCINGLYKSDEILLLDRPRAPHLTIPTTAGTGSESTCFAVVYKNDEKFSIERTWLMPNYVILDSAFLQTLPMYHKKSSLLDAYAQAVESIWAKGATPASKSYALGALRILSEDIDSYMANDSNSATRILHAANLSGKAINISKTTAAHAMSYKLSAMFGLAHGHAVAVCLPHIWKHQIESGNIPIELSQAHYDVFVNLFHFLEMPHIDTDGSIDNGIIETLVSSVNLARLSNHPVEISECLLADIYIKVLQNSV